MLKVWLGGLKLVLLDMLVAPGSMVVKEFLFFFTLKKQHKLANLYDIKKIGLRDVIWVSGYSYITTLSL